MQGDTSTRLRRFLDERYDAGNELHAKVQEFVVELWKEYEGLGLADPDALGQLTSGNLGRFEERLTEMLLARHFLRAGYVLNSDAVGPDLLVQGGERSFWVEATTPAPGAIDPLDLDWSAGDEPTVRSVPYEAIGLRWTNSLSQKRDVLEGCERKGKWVPGYLEKGIVKRDEPYVVALNGCRLGAPTIGFYGISQFPHVVEIAAAIGPLQVTLSRETAEVLSHRHGYRASIRKKSGVGVPTDCFLSERYQGVSAVLAMHASDAVAIGNAGPMIAVHNCHARNRVSVGSFKVDAEYEVEQTGDHEVEIRLVDEAYDRPGLT